VYICTHEKRWVCVCNNAGKMGMDVSEHGVLMYYYIHGEKEKQRETERETEEERDRERERESMCVYICTGKVVCVLVMRLKEWVWMPEHGVYMYYYVY